MFFPGFETRRVAGAGADIHLRIGGSGPPLLLLHGYPQTHVMWHKVAPMLARHFTLVLPDLRGYGESGKPPSDDAHLVYSKRATAADMVAVMAQLGFKQFRLAGHDRGARVAHRLSLDHPQAVQRLALLDIVPTLTMFGRMNQAIASGYYHWLFLIQPNGHPERMIGADPDYYITSKLGAWAADASVFTPEAVAEYQRCFRDPACIHATCEDYRAGAGIDLEHDRADLDKRIQAPLLVLWGAQGQISRHFDVLGCWREKAVNVKGLGLPCGHFLPEERPEDTARAVLDFMREAAV
ncbi:alpha/beta hydrolase [Ferrovibrio sp.]|uniref:alpha/beta fold hydrolase n=1 Tax=Ferrovibrio sp. TaxID=1917215 RepID=UPI0025BAB1FE|nr:alpha/beta hydrolase [Ferrovibrio sp.]MBX3454452.1 alpha/beta hydrolase [Ferrovibrio sp.]